MELKEGLLASLTTEWLETSSLRIRNGEWISVGYLGIQPAWQTFVYIWPYGSETPSSGFVTNCMAAAERKALALECIRFASSIYGSNSEILKEEYGRRKEQRVKHKCKRQKKRRAQVVLEGCRLKTSNRLPPSFSQCPGAFASTPAAFSYPSRVPFVEYLLVVLPAECE